MNISGKIVSKTVTSNGVFARVKVDANGWPKSAMMRFFDIPDEDNFVIGDKLSISLSADPRMFAMHPALGAPYGTESRAHEAVLELESLPPAGLAEFSEGDFVVHDPTAEDLGEDPIAARENHLRSYVRKTGLYPRKNSTDVL